MPASRLSRERRSGEQLREKNPALACVLLLILSPQPTTAPPHVAPPGPPGPSRPSGEPTDWEGVFTPTADVWWISVQSCLAEVSCKILGSSSKDSPKNGQD